MQYGGEPRQVKLTKDLTKYNPAFILGAEGKTIPDTAIGLWGDNDTFVAVEFKDGTKADIAYSSLEFIDK